MLEGDEPEKIDEQIQSTVATTQQMVEWLAEEDSRVSINRMNNRMNQYDCHKYEYEYCESAIRQFNNRRQWAR